MEEFVSVWSESDRQANDLLRSLMRSAKYKWVHRKLNNARWHIIETHTQRLPYLHGNQACVVRNGDVAND